MKGARPKKKARLEVVREDAVREMFGWARAGGVEVLDDDEASDDESVEVELYCVCDYTSYGIVSLFFSSLTEHSLMLAAKDEIGRAHV